MSRSSSELKRISRDILNNRYSVPMAAFLTASLIPTLIEIPFSMTLGDYPGTPQLIISTIADILILLIAQMLDTGVMLVHMNMTRGHTASVMFLHRFAMAQSASFSLPFSSMYFW